MSDNGAPYRSTAWAACLHTHGIDHIRTRPYRPRTNGKACECEDRVLVQRRPGLTLAKA